MDESLPRSLPKLERSGNVTILTFTENKRDLDNMLADELAGHAPELAGCHMLLDFSNVKMITSEELGTLIGLYKKLKASGGQLTLFNLTTQVYEVFEITHLHTVLGICRKPVQPLAGDELEPSVKT
jgi:anti-anti-sigma factor